MENDASIGLDDDHKYVIRDCIEGMKDLEDGCASLVFADPPFNLKFGKDTTQYAYGVSGENPCSGFEFSSENRFLHELWDDVYGYEGRARRRPHEHDESKILQLKKAQNDLRL